MRNLEKVWKAEQEAEKEKTKLEQLRREKQQERELEELETLHRGPDADRYNYISKVFIIFRKKAEKLDWMYAGTSNSTGANSLSEDYLLGKRRLDSAVSERTSSNLDIKIASAPKRLLVDDQSTLERDLKRKSREDPMFVVKQRADELKKKRLHIKRPRS